MSLLSNASVTLQPVFCLYRYTAIVIVINKSLMTSQEVYDQLIHYVSRGAE